MIRSSLEPRYPHLRHFRPVYREFRAGDGRLSQADSDKARRLLGYRPVWRIREGLRGRSTGLSRSSRRRGRSTMAFRSRQPRSIDRSSIGLPPIANSQYSTRRQSGLLS